MKKIVLFTTLLLGCCFVSCGDNEKIVSQVTNSFFENYRDCEIDGILSFYPSYDNEYMFSGSDSISIKGIKYIKEKNEYEVQVTNFFSPIEIPNYTQEKQITLYLTKNTKENPSYIINDSRGLIESNKIPYYAYSTGCINNKLKYNDLDMIKRIKIANDIAIHKATEISNSINKLITIKYPGLVRQRSFEFEIHNHTTFALNGFYIHFTYASCYGEKPYGDDTGYWESDGATVDAGTTKYYEIDLPASVLEKSWKDFFAPRIKKATMEIPVSSLLKYSILEFNGNEYENYIKEISSSEKKE